MARSIATAVGLSVLIASPGAAEPSFRGYSGLLKMPTADTLGRGQYNFGLNTTEAEDLDDPSYLANFGIGADLEAGVWWFHPEHGDNETLVNLKYRFQPGGDGRPGFAVGITDVMDEVDTGIYAVGTWEFGDLVGRIGDQPLKRVRLHAGLGAGAIDDFFFGAEARLGRHFIIMAEHMNDEFSLGARARLWRNLTVQAGILDMDDLAIGATYTYPTSEAGTLAPIIGERSREAAAAPRPPDALVPQVRETPAPETPTTAEAPTQQPPDQQAETAPVEPPPAVVETPPETPPKAPPTSQQEPEAPEPVQPTPPETVEVAAAAPEAEAPPAFESETSTSEEAERGGPEEAVAVEQEPLKVSHEKATVPVPLDDMPVEAEGEHVFVPARQVAEWLGFRVDAKQDRRGIHVTIHAGLKAASFYIGDDRVDTDGQRTQLPAPTYYLDQRVAMVPLEFFNLLGVPTEVDTDAGQALVERFDVVGVVSWGK